MQFENQIMSNYEPYRNVLKDKSAELMEQNYLTVLRYHEQVPTKSKKNF